MGGIGFRMDWKVLGTDFEVDCLGGRGRCGESRSMEDRYVIGLRWKHERIYGTMLTLS